jgi:hypothetical protein
VASGEAAADATLMAADHEHKFEAALDMQASNRLYEEKIEELKRERSELAKARAADAPDAELMAIARRVRKLVLEAGMFANEAMITAGASQFVVFGTQVGTDKGLLAKKKMTDIKVSLTEAQLFHAFTEQLADSIKEFSHFERLDDGLFKGGKYLMRMTLAADQLDGVRGNGRIPHYEQLRRLGDFAMSAKGMEGSIPDKVRVMEKALADSGLDLGGDATERKTKFLAVLMEFGSAVTNEYQAAKDGVVVPDRPAADDPAKAEKDKAYRDAYAKKIGAEMRVADSHGADLAEVIEAFAMSVNRKVG